MRRIVAFRTMTLFHGSSQPIEAIGARGPFGGLFGTVDRRAALSHGDVLHEIDSPRPLDDYALNYETEGAWDAAVEVCGGDEARAEQIMDVECPTPDDVDPMDAAEHGWESQRLRGLLAARLGFTSVEMRDEHGTTWLCLPGCTIRAAQDD